MGSPQDTPFLNTPPEEVIKHFNTSEKEGLSTGESTKRLQEHGLNLLEIKQVSLWKRIITFFWGPIPWMIEVAAILSGYLEKWPDFIMIVALLLINAALGFFQEFKAHNAIEALKKSLALKARVLRDGKWQTIESQYLVPGDVITVKLGNIIPADMKLISGEYLSVDQSALTGESLPVDKGVGDIAFSGTIAKLGSMVGVVTETGTNTFFGKTAKLVAEAKTKSHFQEAVLKIGHFLIFSTLAIVAVILVVDIFRLEVTKTLHETLGQISIFLLVLIIAGIPVALPAVLSMTMAIGASRMAKLKAIVSKLIAVEELAGMDILCSDKTGTMTKNQLTVGDVRGYDTVSKEDVIFYGSLACEEGEDPIDKAILEELKDKTKLKTYKTEKFVPFDPVIKRTEATLTTPDGSKLFACKGAPQVILGLSNPSDTLFKEVTAGIDEFAAKGFRTLGVAKATTEGKWEFIGLIPLFDPPWEDTKETIRKAKEMHVDVKMITGDHTAIAKQLSAELDLGTNILSAKQLNDPNLPEEAIEEASGFAEVFPEHKFAIVKHLQHKKHIVGMTGDGVNDAPALKQADIGIAVSNATDAARAAADLVLTQPGLLVITRAIEEARYIFGRMKSYAMYRISETVRLLLFLFLAILFFGTHPLTTIMIVVIALLNDIPIMMIAYDHMAIRPKPYAWDMKEVMFIAVGLAIVGVITTFGLFWISQTLWQLGPDKSKTLAFMAILCGGNLTIYTRVDWKLGIFIDIFCPLISPRDRS
ncbi:MAG: Calcium-transporting ATPase 1 [Chlamydiae bacterium]|nr:Calcium-transporting ATPase 1 [Chlamydiota bacterium]